MSDSVIKTARRVFEIFELFDATQRPMSLKEVVERFAYPVSSAAALLKSMVALGYLDYDRFSRTYMPTMRMATLGNWVHGALFGEGHILRLMTHLHAVTEETITLGVQSDLFAQYVHVLPSPQPIQYRVSPGTLRPLARSGLGLLLLSARPDATIEKLLRRVNAEEPDPAKRVAFPELMKRIAEVRRDGYVFSRHTFVRGAGIITMLLPEANFGRLFAIGVAGPVDRLEEKQGLILRELRTGIAGLAGGDARDETPRAAPRKPASKRRVARR
jgi:DNA-binding IclR family transcriptional regulator